MALSDYQIPRKRIDLGGGNAVEVRGLGLEDVSFLVSVHSEDVEAIVNTFRGKNKQEVLDPERVEQLVKESSGDVVSGLLQQFPLVAANVIALACDEPDQLIAARRLPLPKQTEALVAIAKLTFEDAEGFKKFVGNVAAVLRSARPQAPQSVPATTKKSRKSTGSTG